MINMYTNTKKTKKFILILVFLMLFNFICPKNVRADEAKSIEVLTGGYIDDAEGDKTNQDTYNYKAYGWEGTNGWFDLSSNFASLIFLFERGVLGLLNDIFCDDANKFEYVKVVSDDNSGYNIKIRLSPESIIKGRFILFNANIFEKLNKNKVDENGNDYYYDDGAGKDGTVNRKR